MLKKWMVALGIAYAVCFILMGVVRGAEISATPDSASLDLNPVYDSSTLKWGFATDDGTIVIQPQFDDFYGRLALLDPNAKSEKFLKSGIEAVEYDHQWQFLSFTRESGQKLTPISKGKSAQSLSNLSDGLARVSFHGKYGYVNAAGNLVIPPKFEEAGNFSDRLAVVKLDGHWLVINPDGKIVRPWSLGASNPLVWFGPLQVSTQQKLSDGARFFDLRFLLYPENSGDKIMHALDAIQIPSSNELAPVRISGIWGYVTKEVSLEEPDKSLAILPRFDDARPFSEGLAAVQSNGKWGYIGNQGEMMIPPQYEEAGVFSNGLAAVKVENKYGYIDTTGRLVIAAQYNHAGAFHGKLAAVLMNHVLSYIDATGKPVFGGYNVLASDFNNADLTAHNYIELKASKPEHSRVMGAPDLSQ